MEKQFQVDILTPEGNIFEGKITSLVVPAALGYLGVLADHAPLVAKITPGEISFREATGNRRVIYNKGKGFIEVARNKATLLLEVVSDG
ncbi:MAG: hypothetical protein V1842_03775 [Candidatus Omnitrophota bacterium]